MATQEQAPAAPQLRRVAAEAHLTFVIDEKIAGKPMPPTAPGRAHAEIVFLAVTAPERGFIEPADLVQAGTADIHAVADRRRNIGGAAGIGRHARRIQRSEAV